jgi:hypothetical protein
MIKKEDRSKFLQKQMDEKQISIDYHFITRVKGLDSSMKLLLNQMCNDIYMNGKITWAQSTYADRIGMTRKHVNKLFMELRDAGVIKGDKDNKPGSPNNTYSMFPTFITNLVKQTCNPGEPDLLPPVTRPVTTGNQTCNQEVTYNKDNKTNKVLLGKEESFGDSSSHPGTPEDWINQLELDI